MTDWPAGWLASRIYDDRVACWLSILQQKLEVLIMDAELKPGVPMWVYGEMTFAAKRYINYLLDNDAMPVELSYLLEAWVEDVEYNCAVAERSLRYVALQFGYPAEAIDNI